MAEKKMIERVTTKEFAESGLFQAVNTILHMFGFVLCRDSKKDCLYPARCRYRGFSEEDNSTMYKRIQATFLREKYHDEI